MFLVGLGSRLAALSLRDAPPRVPQKETALQQAKLRLSIAASAVLTRKLDHEASGPAASLE
jgi:hypothetical protein